MKVCYHVQTHRLPAQIVRLVRVLREMDPDGPILVSHDAGGCPPPLDELAAVPGVHVSVDAGGYGDASHLDRYLKALRWLADHDVDFDWLENITGQCYPLRPLEAMHRMIDGSGFDGFLGHYPVFASEVLTTARDARDRYLFRYRRVGRPSPAKQRWLRPLMAVNYVQPLLRFSTTFSTVGLRCARTPFGPGFRCYGGWFFGTLNRACVEYVHAFVRDNPEFMTYLRGTLAPEEIFLQTVLVNGGRFRLSPDSLRYIDMTASRHGHSRTLGAADVPAAVGSGAHWARKFDLEHDPAALDLLDGRLLHGQEVTP